MVLSPPLHKRHRILSPRADDRSTAENHITRAPQGSSLRQPARPSVATNASQFEEECPWPWKRQIGEDGRAYYWNELTGDSTWELPANEAVDDVEDSIDGEEPVAEGECAIEDPIRHDDELTTSTALLAKLVQLLCQHPEHSILLSDIGLLLNADLRAASKELGGLRNFALNFPGLLSFTGKPGKEKLALLLGTTSTDMSRGGSAAEAAAISQEKIECADASVVQFRGLPYRATIAEIKSFLGRHADSLKDDDSSVQIVLNRDRQASGFARIHFCSPESARLARDELHMQHFETAEPSDGKGRYIEVFLANQKISKAARQMNVAGEKNPDKAQDDEIARELSDLLSSERDGRILLSMVGTRLSNGAREYMKSSRQGLKHIVSQYPELFAMEGIKGSEWVSCAGTFTKSGNPYVNI